MRSFRKFSPADESIAKKLREFRTAIGMSQKELAELTGVSFQQVQKYEKMENRVSAAKLFEFAQILERPIASFYENVKYDGKHYNYIVTTERRRKKIEENLDKDLLPLIRSFNMIKNKQVKKRILALIKEIAGPFYKKQKKHEYS